MQTCKVCHSPLVATLIFGAEVVFCSDIAQRLARLKISQSTNHSVELLPPSGPQTPQAHICWHISAMREWYLLLARTKGTCLWGG